MKKDNFLKINRLVFVGLVLLFVVNANAQKSNKQLAVNTVELNESKTKKAAQLEAKKKIYKYRNDLIDRFSSNSTVYNRVRRVKEQYQRRNVGLLWRNIERELARYKYNYVKFLIEKEHLLAEYSRQVTRSIDNNVEVINGRPSTPMIQVSQVDEKEGSGRNN